MVLMAFASTCGSLVSNLIGAGHSDCVAGTIRQHVRIAYVFRTSAGIAFRAVPQADSGNLYRHTRPAGRCRAFALGDVLHLSVPGSCQCLFPGSFRNRQLRVLHWAMELATLVIYTAYITYIILILQLDVAICWTSEMVYSSFILIFCWLYIKRGNWQGRKI